MTISCIVSEIKQDTGRKSQFFIPCGTYIIHVGLITPGKKRLRILARCFLHNRAGARWPGYNMCSARIVVAYVANALSSTLHVGWKAFAILQLLPVVDVITSCELTSGFVFGHIDICPWSSCIFLPNFMQISLSSMYILAFLRNSIWPPSWIYRG